MTLPGVTVERKDGSPTRTPATSSGTAFMAGLTERGDASEAVKVTSIGDFTDKFGSRQSWSASLYDAVDSFFHEGGSEVYISRLLGPNPVTAFVVLDDAGAADTLRVEAANQGEWGNALNVQVIAGDNAGEFKLVISHDTLGTLETSPSLVDKAAAFAWAETSEWVNLVDVGASALDPAVVAAQSLATGTDDRVNVNDASRAAALARFTKDMGTGQVAIPGATTEAIHEAVGDHALANSRVAIVDFPDTSTIATLTALAVAERHAVTHRERFMGAFWPWDVIPGLTPGTTRVAPPCGRVMGRIAELAGEGRSANVAAAGDRGQAKWAIGVSKPKPSDADRETLNNAGVNVSFIRKDVVTTYGWRTLADANGDPNWIDLGHARLFNGLASIFDEIGESFVFEEIDGQGRVFRRLEGRLKAPLIPLWSEGSLYGDTQQEAFVVDTGPSVNTPATIAAREINAEVGVKISPHGEKVVIRVSKASQSEDLS